MSTRRKSNLRVARQFKEGRYLIVVLHYFSKSNQSYIRFTFVYGKMIIFSSMTLKMFPSAFLLLNYSVKKFLE